MAGMWPDCANLVDAGLSDAATESVLAELAGPHQIAATWVAKALAEKAHPGSAAIDAGISPNCPRSANRTRSCMFFRWFSMGQRRRIRFWRP